MAQFKGVRKLSQKKYNKLKEAGQIDGSYFYVTPDNTEERISNLEGSVSELTPKVMRSLVTPMSAPAKTELVAVNGSNSQAMIEIGEGLSLENGTLKVTGIGDISALLDTINGEVV